MNGLDYFKMAFQKYADFSTRSRRSEFWYFTLFNTILSYAILLGIGAVSEMIGATANMIYSLAAFIPSLAVGVRRLHDTGRSGWWYLIALTGIGVFVLIFWFATDGVRESNKWGSNPKYGADGDVMDHLVDSETV